MKLVYIAGPFTPMANQRAAAIAAENAQLTPEWWPLIEARCVRGNIAKAVNLAYRVAESGHMPVCPHSNTGDPRFLAIQTPEFWYAGTLELMRRCDAIALTDDWRESNGACREVIEAANRRMGLWLGDQPPCTLAATWDKLWINARAALRSRGQEP